MTFLAAEQLIIDRLNAVKLTGVTVYSADELADIEENSQYTPAYHVVYNGYTQPDDDTGIGILQLPQEWLVIVAVRNYTQTLRGQDKRIDADLLCDNVLENMVGYKLSTKHKELKLVSAPQALQNGAFAYYPFAFQTNINIRGVCKNG